MDPNEIGDRLTKLSKLKLFLNKVDEELSFLTKSVDWNLKKLIAEEPCAMVNCSFDSRHRVPRANIKFHEEKCRWRGEGCEDREENSFPDHSGQGSFITLDSELIHEITSGVPSPLSVGSKPFRSVPNTTANLDQNFSREEKLAIYDYVISNTQKLNAFSDLHLQALEKKEEKRELSPWEIAAAERDAKRRRASYRNKVHTNRKSYTEVMREVIEGQMEILKDESSSRTQVSASICGGREKSNEKHHEKRSRCVSRNAEEETRYSSRGSWRKNSKDDPKEKNRSRQHSSSYKNEISYGRNRQNEGIDSKSRSRSIDNHKKWKRREERYFHYSKSNRD